MKHISKSQSQNHQNGLSCVVFEYGSNGEIDGSVAEINGRYPESGWSMNTISHLEFFVISGRGTLTTAEKTVELKSEDVVIINPNESYYYVGNHLRIFMASTPPWSPEQYATHA